MPLDNFCSSKLHSFHRATLSENYSLLGTEIVRGQMSAHISAVELVYSLNGGVFTVFGNEDGKVHEYVLRCCELLGDAKIVTGCEVPLLI